MRSAFGSSIGVVGLAALFVGGPAMGVVVPVGIGVVGDSLSDEYQFPIFTGTDRTNAKNYVEILAAGYGDTPALNFGAFSLAPRPAPRNAGYEYNWAQDGDTSASAIAGGQHLGVAGLAASGEVDVAVVMVGANDFRTVFIAPDPVAALTAAVPALLSNVGTAVGTILAANPNVKVVVGNVVDVRHTPQIQAAVAGGLVSQAFVDAVSGAIQTYNGLLAAQLAGQPRVGIADLYGVLEAGVVPGFGVAGIPINPVVPSIDPRSLFVDPVHAGTVGQAMLANEVLGVLNGRFGYDVPVFRPADVAAIAGVPEPSVVMAVGPAVVALVSRRRRRVG